MKNKKKILITGGSGFIGSCFARYLKKKYKIFTLDKKNKNPFLKEKSIVHIKCDLCNYIKLKKKIQIVKPNIIVHLAAQSTIDFIDKKKKSYLKNNIIGTNNIVKISNDFKVEKFIFASTASVYKQKNRNLTEKDKVFPNNIYGKTKRINEEFIISNFNGSHTKYCILRFFNVCSSLNSEIGEFHNPETHLIPKVINSLIFNKKITIYGNKFKTFDGTCVRDYIHIKDIVNGIEKSIKYLNKKKSGIFNLGSGYGNSVLKIIKYGSKIIRKNPIIKLDIKRKGDVEKLVCSISKARNKLKWSPKYSNINTIIKDEIKWQLFLKGRKLRRFFYN